MTGFFSRKTKYIYARALTTLIGIAVNCLFGYMTYRLRLPLYIDTVGTIGVTLIAGPYPGILTGVVSNVLCSFFNHDAMFYSLISALIAVATTAVYRRDLSNKWRRSWILIVILGLISGILGTLFQFILIGESQFEIVNRIANQIGSSSAGLFLSASFINIILNTIDKGISVILALLIASCVPEDIRVRIRNSLWQQKPLSDEERDRIGSDVMKKKSGRSTLYLRIIGILVFVAFLLAIVLCGVSVELYQSNLKKEYAENAYNAARLASTVVDPDKIDEYIEKGRDVPGYNETEARLYNIRDNSRGVKYLYLVQIREDGCYGAFDLETEDTPQLKPGDRLDFEAAFKPYLPALFAGEEIPPIESNDISGWVLTTYYPIKNSEGHTVCYAGADVSMVYLSDYIKDYIARTILIFSGMFILIIGYGVCMSDYFLFFPIRTMTESTRDYARGGEDQKQIDDNVKRIKGLDIRTNDEIEDLYEAICKMSVDMAEQVRSLRRYADTNSQMQNGLIVTMADMVESRDSDTGAHTQKTAEYVKIIVDGLRKKGYYSGKITDKFVSDVIMSAPLHDVGKINISDVILNKPGKLTDEEFEIMKTHTTAGKDLIDKAISTVQGEHYLREARYMAAYHHERFDGKGYPKGLHGEEIPLSARIMAVADVFDALTSKRIYKPAFSLEKSVEILKEGSGTQFDPKCIEVFLENIDLVKSVLKKYNESD